HMLVDPDFHGFGVGRKMMELMQGKYKDFHQQMLTADGEAVDFYKALGFERTGKTEPMWVYAGNDH
ncbi:GNAT family N-acetyltransferase, partial [Vibrio variabilis]|uniref:GNAT family N-acetyltransferase n=1 Tax=Vibrio variabilis TaxID=990271 RepID=UPI0013A6A7AE